MRTLLIPCVVWMLAMGTGTLAATVVVTPGPGTPVQDAIDAASPGDTIKLTNGSLGGTAFFGESVRVTKRLRLIGLGRGGTSIDSPCTDPIALEVAADDVILRGFTVRGGTVTSIDITGRSNVRLSDVEAQDDPSICDGADYGINVVGSSRVKISRSFAIGRSFGDGFDEAGIRLSGIGVGGNVLLKGVFSVGNVRGIVVESSTDLPGGSPGIRLSRVGVTGVPAGILVTNSDGVRIDHSEVRYHDFGPPAPGSIGVHLDATSDGNVVRSSFMNGFETDVRDDGTGNCWLRNVFSTGSVDCN